MSIFQRIRDVAFKSDLELLPHVHALDLAKTGFVQCIYTNYPSGFNDLSLTYASIVLYFRYIKPHIDSIKVSAFLEII